MKLILSTLVAAGVLAGAAHAQPATFDPFYDPSLSLPRSDVSNDEHRQALPRAGQAADESVANKPFPQDVFPDVVVSDP